MGMGRGIFSVTFEDGSSTHASNGIMYCNADMSGGHCWSSSFGRNFSTLEVSGLADPGLLIEYGWSNDTLIREFMSAAIDAATELPKFTPRHHETRFVDGFENDPEYYGHSIYRTPEEKSILDGVLATNRDERTASIENYMRLKGLASVAEWVEYFGDRQISVSYRPWEPETFAPMSASDIANLIVSRKWSVRSMTGEVKFGHVSFEQFGAPMIEFNQQSKSA